ncbi:MAG: hypothetical protein EOO24_31815 [Comamonadaceae bacterium]|nr:MAG: hypothetical protein EOO24_31815 [Comamonadaceae bacterium]
MTAPIHAIPSPAQQQAAAELASLPVEMLSRTTSNVFSLQASFLLHGWMQTLQAGRAMADALQARPEAPRR